MFSTGAVAQTFTGADGALGARATFAAGTGYVDITLWNLQTGAVQGAANELTGISFDSSASFVGATQSLYRSGDLVVVSGATTKTGAGAAGNPTLEQADFGWDWRAVNYLSALDGDVGTNGPDLGIINAAATTFGNSLFNGGGPSDPNGPHNPLYQSFAAGVGVTFRVYDGDITSVTSFSNVLFHFNTDGNTTLCARGGDCTTPPIPEPETYALMLAGLAAVGFMARRRRQA